MGVPRWLLTVSACICLVAPSSAPAMAASGQPVPSVAIDLIVQLIAPTVLSVGITYTCLPSPIPLGDVEVTVTQSTPAPAQAFGGSDLTCDGAQHRTDVIAVGGPVFVPGDALATAQACTQLTCGSDARKVVIVPAGVLPAPVPPVVQLPVPARVPALPAVP